MVIGLRSWWSSKNVWRIAEEKAQHSLRLSLERIPERMKFHWSPISQYACGRYQKMYVLPEKPVADSLDENDTEAIESNFWAKFKIPASSVGRASTILEISPYLHRENGICYASARKPHFLQLIRALSTTPRTTLLVS